MHGTIYPIRFDYDQDRDLMFGYLVLFGFQIAQAFRDGILLSIQITRAMKFDNIVYRAPIFKNFITFMYNARLKYKREKNNSMAQCVKVFINSLYGKYGEKHHESHVIISDEDLANE